jgi:hypothetical protein
MKKWLGTICSFAVAALSFVFLSIAQFVMKMSSKLVNERTTSNAWDLINETSENSPAGFGFYKFATITLIVIACLLAVWAIVLLLKNLGVLKLKFNLALVNNILLALFAIFAICALIALFVFLYIKKLKKYKQLVREDEALYQQKMQAETQEAQAKAEEAQRVAKSKGRVCKYCGVDVPDDANACPGCGSRDFE